MLRAARTADTSISDIRPLQRWKWIRIHNLSLSRYMRKGGLTRLREELEAENGGVDIPAGIRWLSGAKVRTRYQEAQGGTSTVVATVLGEVTCVCMSNIYYPAALADSSLINFPLYDRILSPTTMGYTGATLSPPSHSA